MLVANELKILIIDDDTDLTTMLGITLHGLGCQVICANSAPEGIEKVKTCNPDLIIIDYMMPIMNGSEVCQAIRSFCHTPVLVLSVLDDPDLIAKTLDAGADDYMVKPVPPKVLLANINNLTRRNIKKAQIAAFQ